MQNRHIPMRKCLGCGEMKEKKQLVRVVRSKEGEISIDLVGKKSGRGAYICHDKECLLKAIKHKRLEKEFSCKIEDEIYKRLEGEINGNE